MYRGFRWLQWRYDSLLISWANDETIKNMQTYLVNQHEKQHKQTSMRRINMKRIIVTLAALTISSVDFAENLDNYA